MMTNINNLLYCLSCLGVLYTVTGHPQCLDFGPPFEVSNPGLSFCSEYSNFTCCSREKDAQIRNSYTSLSADVEGNGQLRCRERLRRLLCLQCSPFEAHVYDGEVNDRRQFPGLCDPYCRDLYRECQEVILLVADTPGIRTSVDQGVDAFCDLASLPDPDYCFPDLDTNEELQDDISRTTRTADGCLCLQEFADNLMNPVIFAAIPDDSGRILVGEQRGILYVFLPDKTKLSEPFMDIRHMVLTSSSGGDERGFLGFIFHPSFKTNRKFYVYFSMLENRRHKSRVSEFKVSEENKNSVQADSEKIIIEVDQPYSNHNGGQV